MAIQFVVEDGTNKEDATSYVTLDEFRQYWENRGVDYSGEADSDLQVKLILATEYIDNLYIYQGEKEWYKQALEFPRDYVLDRNYVDQSGDVPQAIKDAVCIAAKYELDGNELLSTTGNIASKSMGPVSVTFGSGGEKPVKLDKVARLIGDLTEGRRIIP